METSEWSLVLFTILGQMAVGSFLVWNIVHLFTSRKAGQEEADRLGNRALIAIIGVLLLGLIASLFHLGNVTNAYRAASNLGTSWLSREITFVVVFFILSLLFAILQWFKLGGLIVRSIISWVGVIAGVLLVLSMAMVYMMPTQPAWNSFATPVAFFTTTLLLGVLAMGAAYVANYAYVRRKEPDCEEVQCDLLRTVSRWIAIFAVVLVGIELVVAPVYVASLAGGSAAAASSASLMVGEFGTIFVLRLVLAFVGAALFGLFLYQNALSPGKETMMSGLMYGAFVLVLVAELMGRYLFYATQVQIGV
jgi:anaerobic dimethyl sulfoxide reductase subunit C (anchor subunit)